MKTLPMQEARMSKSISILLSISIALIFSVFNKSYANPLPDLYENWLPSVVTLHTFEDKVSDGEVIYAKKPNGLGSGVIISEQGLIVTAAHVVHSADGLYVEFSNGHRRSAKVISSLVMGDLALVKVDQLPSSAKVATLGNSEDARIGEQIFVIGAPLGINRTLTIGYLSGKHPKGTNPESPLAELFQTDAAINPGNSGGPLFNMKGEVIGIASFIQTRSGGSDGLGFAVTANSVKELMLERGQFWSGMVFHLLDGKLSQALQLPQDNGILVEKVIRDSVAYKAGLRGGKLQANLAGEDVIIGGDIILSINGKTMGSEGDIRDILQMVKHIQPGTSLKLELWRRGQRENISIIIPEQQ